MSATTRVAGFSPEIIADLQKQYVYDANLLSWVPMNQPILNAGSVTVSGSVAVSNFPSSQAVTGPLTDGQLRATAVPISGSVTANAGSNLNTSALALAATQTDKSQLTQITDGTRDGTVKAASTLPVATDTALVVTLRETLSTAVTGSVAVSNMIAAVETGLAKDATLTGKGQYTRVTDGTTDGTIKAGSTLPAATDTAVVVTLRESLSTAVTGPLTDTQLRASSVQTASNAVLVGANGSTTPLAADATFTGTAIDMLNYSTLRVSVFADVASALNGLQVQFSEDSTNWDFVRQTSYAPGSGGYAVFNRIANYARVVYTNGATAQTVFRLQTLVAPTSAEYARHFLSEPPTDTNSGIITQSVLAGRSAQGSPTYVTGSMKAAGTLPVFIDTALVVTDREANYAGMARGAEWATLLQQQQGLAGLLQMERASSRYGAVELR